MHPLVVGRHPGVKRLLVVDVIACCRQRFCSKYLSEAKLLVDVILKILSTLFHKQLRFAQILARQSWINKYPNSDCFFSYVDSIMQIPYFKMS